MALQLRDPEPPESSVVPGTRDCPDIDCGARQGMLLRDLIPTAEGSLLIYVCEHCGVEVNLVKNRKP